MAGEQDYNAEAEYEDSAYGQYEPRQVGCITGVVFLLYVEQRGQGHDAPAENLCCSKRREGVNCVCLGYEDLQDVCTYISYEIAKDVDHDDGCCSEVDVQSAFCTDDQSHRHCEEGEKQLILDAGEAATQCHYCVQNGEDMYYPRGGNVA